MKFPLKERPFDRVQLSPDRYFELEQLTNEVVEANLNEFHEFVHTHNRVMPSGQYKAIKKRDKVTVYKQLTHKSERVFGPLGRPVRDGPLLLPKLVACGTVRGRMDDMLLGTAVRHPLSVVVKTAYVDDEIVDCSVLHELEGASEEDPFRFLALKWIVKSKVQGLNSVVAPRDMIVMQSSGLIASEGIGFHLLHSVDAHVPECPSLEGKYPILRSRISTMFIFRQLAPEIIEIYTTNYVSPNGSAPEAVAVATSAKSMSSSWKSLGCSHNMKLSWIIQNKEAYMGVNLHRTAHLNTGDVCELCTKKATLTGRLDDCVLCDARVCSRCRDTKSLHRANRRLELQTRKFEVCKTCLFRAVNDDSVRIAAEMNLGVAVAPWNKPKDPANRTFSYASSTSSGRAGSGSRRGHSHRDTMSTISSSGQCSERERDRDLNSLQYSRFLAKDQPAQRAGSVASSAYTDLDFEGNEFHDDDDVESVIMERRPHDNHNPNEYEYDDDEAWERKQYLAYLAQQRELKRIRQHMQRRQGKCEDETAFNGQITPFATRQTSSHSHPCRRPPPASHLPSPVPMPVHAQPPSSTRSMPSASDMEQLKHVDLSHKHFENLYAQMKTLQLAAEKTFELTQDNERQLSSQRTWTR